MATTTKDTFCSHQPPRLVIFIRMPTFSDPASDNYMRRALLARLGWISFNEPTSADPLTIASLRNQYNKFMEKIEHQQSNSRVDFMMRLPPELSLCCLYESLPTRYYARRLLDLTMVSTRWKELIVQAKELWVYVDVRASQPDAMATLAAFLQLSGRRLIQLTIWGDPGDEWDELKSLLIKHQQRIRTIYFKQESELIGSHRFSIARRVMQSFKHLRGSIEVHLGDQPSLSLHPWQVELLVESSDHYVLRGLDFPLSILSKNNKILRQIGNVTTDDTLANLGSVLPLMTNLTSIWLRPGEQSEDGSLQITSPSSVEILSTPVRLTSLTSFQAFDLSLSSLVSSAAVTLSDLTVAISRRQWKAFIACLELITNLKELSVEIRRPTSEDGNEATFELPSMNPNQGLTALSLQVQNSADSALFGMITSAFAILYPGIQSIKLENIDLGISHAVLRKYLEGLKSLKYLGIWDVTVGEDLEIEPIFLPSLKRLDFECSFAPYVHTPTLESVRMSGEAGLATTRLRSTLAIYIWNISKDFRKTLDSLNHENYPSLQSITMDLPISRRDWQMPSLPSLRKITVTSNNRLDQSASMLCISFLYNPHHCPVLEEIELNGFVEWDILMLMLERRNFRIDGVKRISTLKMPLTPPFLEIHLESLLRGVYTERPPNEEISTYAIAEALCDVETFVVSMTFSDIS